VFDFKIDDPRNSVFARNRPSILHPDSSTNLSVSLPRNQYQYTEATVHNSSTADLQTNVNRGREALANSKSQILQERSLSKNSIVQKSNFRSKKKDVLVSSEVEFITEPPQPMIVKMPKYVKVSSKLPFDINTLKVGREYMEQMKYMHNHWQPPDTTKDLQNAIRLS